MFVLITRSWSRLEFQAIAELDMPAIQVLINYGVGGGIKGLRDELRGYRIQSGFDGLKNRFE